LSIQNPPNAGVTTAVGGNLGVDLASIAGFDIDGRDNTTFVAANLAGSTATTFHNIDLSSGALSASLGSFGERMRGITRATPTTTVYGLTDANTLVRISLANPPVVTPVGTITGLAANDALIGIDVRPSTGLLYGVGALGGVYTIDPATAAATKGQTLTTALTGTSFGFDFNPTGPVALRLVSDAEQNLRVADITSATVAIDDTALTMSRDYVLGAAAYANNIPGATTTTLYALDAANDRLVAVVTPNSGRIREIGALGFDVTVDASFEIVGPETGLIADGSKLYNLNLATGAATIVGNIDTPVSRVHIAAPPSATTPAANSMVYVLDDVGGLSTIARNAPGTRTPIGVATFGASEVLVGFDIRPSTGELWALTRDATTGRLYTLDPATAIATLRGTLDVPLQGVSFGMDFNPTGPVALRIVSHLDQNLRIVDPMTAAAATDTPISAPPLDIGAAAYTNSYAGATATQLFTIDLASTSLMVQNPPNAGVETPIGTLSLVDSFVGGAAFDIAGGNNGLVLASLRKSTEATMSRLYRVNLTTGATTEIGTGLGVGLRGLAIQIK
jgi:hypothetical protein